MQTYIKKVPLGLGNLIARVNPTKTFTVKSLKRMSQTNPKKLSWSKFVCNVNFEHHATRHRLLFCNDLRKKCLFYKTYGLFVSPIFMFVGEH
jgi:hypothetical protein